MLQTTCFKMKEKIIKHPKILKVLDQYDSRCYKYFKDVLEAKHHLRAGKSPPLGFHVVLNAITVIDNCSTNLKYYQGYIKGKKEILKSYEMFKDTQKRENKKFVSN